MLKAQLLRSAIGDFLAFFGFLSWTMDPKWQNLRMQKVQKVQVWTAEATANHIIWSETSLSRSWQTLHLTVAKCKFSYPLSHFLDRDPNKSRNRSTENPIPTIISEETNFNVQDLPVPRKRRLLSRPSASQLSLQITLTEHDRVGALRTLWR